MIQIRLAKDYFHINKYYINPFVEEWWEVAVFKLRCINRGFESHCRLICFQLFLFQNFTPINAYDDTTDFAVKTIYLVRGYW